MKKRRGGLSPSKYSPPGKVWGFAGIDYVAQKSIYEWLDADDLHEACKRRMDRFDSLPPERRRIERDEG